MITLYRKYRPSNFQEVVGQNHVKITLQNEIQTLKLAHAYLFCGPRAVGKTTFARIFAKAINCLNRKGDEFEPCNKCDSCQQIDQDKSFDIMEIDAASHTGVDNVRENIIASARVVPASSKFKVFIIDEAHMLTVPAFNALLKTLEEPPAYVVFILCTTEIHKVPTTIISRCQRFDFKRIGMADMIKKLKYIADSEKIKIEDSILESIARHSDGYMRDAESLFGQILAIGGKNITQQEADLVIPRSDIGEVIQLIEYLVKKDSTAGIALINKLLDDGVDLDRFTIDLIEILRKLMLLKVNPVLAEKLSLDFGEDLEIRLNNITKGLELSRVILFLEKFIEARPKLKNSFISQLPLELVITELCSAPAVAIAPTIKAQSQVATSSVNNEKAQERPYTPTATNIEIAEPAQPLANSASGASISKEDFLARWHEFLAKVKQQNHSLSFVLKVCQPREVAANQVCLAFKYKFHKDRISETNIKALVEKILTEVYGQALTIEAIVDENMAIENIPASPVQAEGEAITKTPTPAQPIAEDTKPDQKQVDKLDTADKKTDNMMNSLLDTFGGKVVG